MSELEKTVYGAVLEIAQRNRPEMREVKNSQALIDDLGFGSLDIAELIATLELKLNKDPFSSKVAISSVRTLQDLCNAYVN